LPNRDERIKKLRFQSCKRGLLEAELVLRPFAQKHLNSLDDAELDDYERLINMEDLDLWEVISGRREVPQGTDPALIGLIRGFLPRSNGYQEK
jgi:antitoxin CptB